MLQFAQINSENIVIQINLLDRLCCMDIHGNFNEGLCVKYLQSLYGQNTKWIRSFPDGSYRKQPAQSGYIYDPERDIFLEPNNYPSWIFDEEKQEYVPPFPKPVDGKHYIWKEEETRWAEYTEMFPPKEPLPDYEVE